VGKRLDMVTQVRTSSRVRDNKEVMEFSDMTGYWFGKTGLRIAQGLGYDIEVIHGRGICIHVVIFCATGFQFDD